MTDERYQPKPREKENTPPENTVQHTLTGKVDAYAGRLHLNKPLPAELDGQIVQVTIKYIPKKWGVKS